MSLLLSNRALDKNDNKKFIFTIDTSLGTGDSFQLPLPLGQSYNFIIKWGDGNSDIITAYNQAETLHTYASGGEYQVSISGKCGGWSFSNAGDKLKITSIDQWGDVGFDYLTDGFYGCSNLSILPAGGIISTHTVPQSLFRACTSLSSIPNDLFSSWTELINASLLFFGCTGLTGILPTDLFRYNTSITAFANCFQNCTGITGIPTDFFKYNTAVTTFANCFNGCIKLTSLPESLFYYNSVVTAYNNTFEGCRNMSLPSVLFNLSNLSGVTTFNSFMRALNTTYSNTGIIQDIWNYALSATSLNTFLNQISLSNYASIPGGWKGL